jgi:hypothetical protein
MDGLGVIASTEGHTPSQVFCLDWRHKPIVVAAVSKSNWRFNEFERIGVVEGGQLNRNVVTADFLNIPARERTYATVLTEEMMGNPVTKLIVG